MNFLCLLGWNPGDDREKMPIAEIIRLFDLPEEFNVVPAPAPAPESPAAPPEQPFSPDQTPVESTASTSTMIGGT